MMGDDRSQERRRLYAIKITSQDVQFGEFSSPNNGVRNFENLPCNARFKGNAQEWREREIDFRIMLAEAINAADVNGKDISSKNKAKLRSVLSIRANEWIKYLSEKQANRAVALLCYTPCPSEWYSQGFEVLPNSYFKIQATNLQVAISTQRCYNRAQDLRYDILDIYRLLFYNSPIFNELFANGAIFYDSSKARAQNVPWGEALKDIKNILEMKETSFDKIEVPNRKTPKILYYHTFTIKKVIDAKIQPPETYAKVPLETFRDFFYSGKFDKIEEYRI